MLKQVIRMIIKYLRCRSSKKTNVTQEQDKDYVE